MQSDDMYAMDQFLPSLSDGCAMCLFSHDDMEGLSSCFPEQDYAGSCSAEDSATFDSVIDCEEGVVECTEEQVDALVHSFDAACMQCLMAHNGPDDHPDITPCLTNATEEGGNWTGDAEDPSAVDGECDLGDAQSMFCPHFDLDESGALCPEDWWQVSAVASSIDATLCPPNHPPRAHRETRD